MDGRVARGARNRQALIDAALDLVVEQQTFPTAQAISEKAGVATRSLFHHFPDLESLFAEVAAIQASRHWGALQPADPDQTLRARVEAAVAQRAELYEGIAGVRTVAVRHEHEWPGLASLMRASRAELRRHLRQALRPEIDGADRATVAALEMAGSWEAWQVLRRDQGLSLAQARAAVVRLITSTVEREPDTWAARSCS